MTHVRDYSLAPIGTQIDGGVIQLCPHCDKNGLATDVYGTTYYTHSQEFGFDSANKPVMDWKWCPTM